MHWLVETPEQVAKVHKLKKTIVGSCNKCNGTGIDKTGEQCGCMHEFRRLTYYLMGNLPEITWDKDLASFAERGGDKKAIKYTESFINHLDKFIKNGIGPLFYGDYGTGKTTLACIIGKEAINAGKSVWFYTMAEFVDDIVKNQSGYTQRDIASLRAEKSEILILDDFGRENPNQKSGLQSEIRTKMDKILRIRADQRLVTIGSTNLDIKKTANLYGQSIFSILQASMKFIEVKGSDLRQKVADTIWDKIIE